ncbi:hypothetical protein BT69DRAFT_1298390 [Atractiella rhizophila]|nr:hypothetical protein BT69DRAFT_1298390 [Atractiella rhizophila]
MKRVKNYRVSLTTEELAKYAQAATDPSELAQRLRENKAVEVAADTCIWSQDNKPVAVFFKKGLAIPFGAQFSLRTRQKTARFYYAYGKYVALQNLNVGGGMMYKNLGKEKRHKMPRRKRYHKAMMQQGRPVGIRILFLVPAYFKDQEGKYAINRFAIRQLASHLQILVAMYITISPRAFLRINELFKFIRHTEAPLWDLTSITTFSTGLVLIFNSSYEGGDTMIDIGGVDFRVRQRPGDILFLLASAAPHWITDVLAGERQMVDLTKTGAEFEDFYSFEAFENQAAANERFKAKEFKELQEAKAVFAAKRAVRNSNDWNSAAKKNLKRKR